MALVSASRLSAAFFGRALPAEAVLHCNQYEKNPECIRARCPLWEEREWEEGTWKSGQGGDRIGPILPHPSSI
ncbi:MAG: hypothetical protein WGN25_12035 [Candidatus Electrothrix sp. GW3-4]|uniref:hypothetical protein n=1 Tax=Candidatus Electrothrix sp. GW3-4 TaxID=3126740 RepID=UPI0030CAE955